MEHTVFWKTGDEWKNYEVVPTFKDAEEIYSLNKELGIDTMILSSVPKYGSVIHHLLHKHSNDMACC
jgi:hypothetical protein